MLQMFGKDLRGVEMRRVRCGFSAIASMVSLALACNLYGQSLAHGDVVAVQPFIIIPEPVPGTLYVFDNAGLTKQSLFGFNGSKIRADGQGLLYVENLGTIEVYDSSLRLLRKHTFEPASSDAIATISIGPSRRAFVLERNGIVRILTPAGDIQRSVQLPSSNVLDGDVFPDECRVAYREILLNAGSQQSASNIRLFDICSQQQLPEIPRGNQSYQFRVVSDGIVALDAGGIEFADLRGNVAKRLEFSRGPLYGFAFDIDSRYIWITSLNDGVVSFSLDKIRISDGSSAASNPKILSWIIAVYGERAPSLSEIAPKRRRSVGH
jgi:hypothetical protein